MNEIILSRGVPKMVTPSVGHTYTIQNSMITSDDPLYISAQSDLTVKWIEIKPGDAVKFGEPMYLMQKAWDTMVFPVIAHS